MSEYTCHSVAHIEDLKAFCSELAGEGATAAVIVDCFKHPLRKHAAQAALAEWKTLPYPSQWAIVLSDKPFAASNNATVVGYFLLDEDRKRWRLDLRDSQSGLELLFSDRPWGDHSDRIQERDWERIRRSKSLSEEDLVFLEGAFRRSRQEFGPFLRIGAAFEFLEVVGLPIMEMFDDSMFDRFFRVAKGRVMLWAEFEALLG